MNWTPEKVAQLLELDARGKTSTEIVEIMGGDLNRNKVLGKLHRLKGGSSVRQGGRVRPLKRVHVGYAGLGDLSSNQCRWPCENGFCGAERLEGAVWPYCETHQLAARRKY